MSLCLYLEGCSVAGAYLAVPCGAHMCPLPRTCQPILISPVTPPPPQRLVWMPSTLEQWGGERGRWVRRGGRGQTGCNLELSYCFNKRLKVQQRCSNSYQQPLTHSVFLLDAASPPQEALCFHSASQLYSVCAAY